MNRQHNHLQASEREQRRERRRKQRRAGITLVEIMVVLVIIAMIAGGAAVAILPNIKKAKVKQAIADCKAIQSGTELYLMDSTDSECPTVSKLKESKVLQANTKSTDPWGAEYRIECEGSDIYVISAGEDGQFGNEDDLPPIGG